MQEQKDKYLRLFAEFDNYKRRTAKESIDLIQTAGKDIISASWKWRTIWTVQKNNLPPIMISIM